MTGKRSQKTMILAIALMATAAAFSAHHKKLVLTDDSGLAMQGYDPVAFFEKNEAVEGEASIHAKHDGATYRFVSKANRKRFRAAPEKYAPQFGGYCAMAMAMGMLEEADPRFFLVHDGEHLLLQRNEKAHKMFGMNPDGNYEKAKANWPKVLEEHGN